MPRCHQIVFLRNTRPDEITECSNLFHIHERRWRLGGVPHEACGPLTGLGGFGSVKTERNVTKAATHKALKSIVLGKLTFAERACSTVRHAAPLAATPTPPRKWP